MTVRRLDPNTGDIVTSGVQFLNGREEVAQTVRTRLKLFLGEYFRDITQGTPWFQSILGKGPSIDVKDSSIRRVILQTPNVTQIVSYNTDYDINERKYSVTAQILTTFGETNLIVNGVI